MMHMDVRTIYEVLLEAACTMERPLLSRAWVMTVIHLDGDIAFVWGTSLKDQNVSVDPKESISEMLIQPEIVCVARGDGK